MSDYTDLRANAQRARAKRYLDLRIPDLEPTVAVRFRPLGQGESEKLTKAALRDKSEDSTVTVHARVLANASIGVWIVNPEGVPISLLDGEPLTDLEPDVTPLVPRAGADLPTLSSGEIAEMFQAKNAAACVRALYVTDGDLISASVALQAFSGKESEEIEKQQQQDLDKG